MKALRRVMKLALGLGILALVIFLMRDRIDPDGLRKTLGALTPPGLLILALMTAALPLIRAANWRFLLQIVPGAGLPFRDYLVPVLAGNTLSLFLPARAGELLRFVYLRDRLPVGICVGSVLFERGVHVLTLVLLSLFGIWRMPSVGRGYLLAAALGFVLLLIGMLVIFQPRHARHARRIVDGWSLIPEKVKGLLWDFADFGEHLPRRRGRVFLFCVFSAAHWSWSLFHCYLMFRFLGLGIPVGTVFTVVPVGMFISMLPVSVGGVGTRDAAFLFLFAGWLAPEQILSFSLVFFFFRYVFMALLGAPFLLRLGKARKLTAGD